MYSRTAFSAILLAFVVTVGIHAHAQTLAPTPPMGWNSWDAYGFTINEADFKANATVLASLEQYGWQYAIIDEGWYMANPYGHNLEERKYLWDANGLLIPDESRFPSAAGGAGFKPLADWLHKRGLRFGIHIVRGIPRQVVAQNLPIAGTKFHAADAADTTSPCPWDEGNWGVADNDAGQAYYDSMLKKYASWGLDFLKVDCIAANPYRATEIRQIANAIRKTGRPIVLSLSPGPTALENAAEVGKYAQMWRISNDHWDGWTFTRRPQDDEFPFGIRDAFDRLPKWFAYAGPGNWPDADMLPVGYLGPHPGWGEPRQSRETHDEQQTEFVLWTATRSPLILGANLTKLDDFTRSLITNQMLIYMDQNATYSRPVDTSGMGESVRIWRTSINDPGTRGYTEYFAFFNLGEQAVTIRANWKQLGLDGAKHTIQSAWEDSVSKELKEMTVTLPAHGSALYQVR